MNETALLTKTFLKETLTPLGDSKKRKMKSALFILGMGALLLIYVGIFTLMFVEMMNTGLKYEAINTSFSMLSLMLILITFTTFPSVFYFSKDLPTLLSMPLKPQSIIMAKTLVLFVFQTPLVAMLGLPAFVAAIYTHTFTIFQLVLIFVGALIVSWCSLVIVGILTILIVRCFPSLANKDRFMKIFGVLVVVFAIGLSVVSMNMGESIGAREVANLSIPEGIFLPVWVALNAIRSQNVLWIAALLVLPVVLSYVFLLLAKTIYLKSAVSAIANTPKKMKAAKMDTRQRSMVDLFRQNEFRSLFRTPAYFTNLVMVVPLIPILMDVLAYQTMSKMTAYSGPIDLAALLESVGVPLWAIGLSAGMFGGFMFSSLNSISATVISRQGTNGIHFLKTIPVPIQNFLTASLQVGTIMSMSCMVLSLPALFFVFTPCPWILPVTFLLGSIPACVLANQIDLIADLLRPKLVWQEETEVVKNNMNIFLVMLVTLAAAGIIVGVYWILPVSVAWKSIICLILIVLADIALWNVPVKIWKKKM